MAFLFWPLCNFFLSATSPVKQRIKPKISVSGCVVPPPHSQWSEGEKQARFFWKRMFFLHSKPLHPLTFTSTADGSCEGMLTFCDVILCSFWLLRRGKTGKETCEWWECVCKYDDWRGVTRTRPTTKKDVLERKMSIIC